MSRTSRILSTLGILFLLTYPPIAFSAYGIGSRTLIQLIVLLIFFLWFASQILQGRFPIPGNSFAWLLVALTAYLIASSYLSIYFHCSATELRNILSYFAIFLIAIRFLTDSYSLRRYLWILALLGVALTLLGEVMLIRHSTTIFGVVPVHNVDHLAATFPNYDHFAAYLGMIIPVTLALWWTERSQARPILLLATGVMTAGLFLTLSRGGIGSFLVGMVVFVALLPRTGEDGKRWRAVLAILIICVVAMLVVVRQPLSNRWIQSGEIFPSARIALWKSTIAAFQSRPVFGFGIGTFHSFLPAYSLSPNVSDSRHALNDYLEWLSELGIVGIALAAAVLIAFSLALVTLARRQRGSGSYPITIAAIVSMLVMVLNAAINFPFHIPALAITCAFLAALPFAPMPSEEVVGYVRLQGSPVSRALRCAGALLIALLLASHICRPYLSQKLMKLAGTVSNIWDLKSGLTLAHWALNMDPYNAATADDVAWQYWRLRGTGYGYQEPHSAIAYFKRAAELEPFSARYARHLGEALATVGKLRDAQQALRQAALLDRYDLRPRLRWIEVTLGLRDTTSAIREYRRILPVNRAKSEQVIRHAYRWLRNMSVVATIIDSTDVDVQLTFVDLLNEAHRWRECRIFLEEQLSRTDDKRIWQKYLDVLKIDQGDLQWLHAMVEYIKLYPEDTYMEDRLIRALEDSDLEFPTNEKYVQLGFPNTASPRYKIAEGRRLLKRIDYEDAGEVFFNVLESDPENTDALMGLGQSYEYSGKYIEAMLCYRSLLKLDSENYDARYRLGIAYRQQKMYAQAVEQLEECLFIKPQDEKARRHVLELYRILDLPVDSARTSPLEFPPLN